ncbi:MAG: hypothetical protein KIS63_13555 [Caldilineales bacterium]|nr:hypothetical protein [Caldilineales bacterium]
MPWPVLCRKSSTVLPFLAAPRPSGLVAGPGRGGDAGRRPLLSRLLIPVLPGSGLRRPHAAALADLTPGEVNLNRTINASPLFLPFYPGPGPAP